MANADPFSMSTLLSSLQHLPFTFATEPMMTPAVPPPPRGIIFTIPQPRYDPKEFLTPQYLEYSRLQSLFNLMTSSKEEVNIAPFKEMISRLSRRELQEMAYLLTSDPDYFLAIARNKNGSHRLQKLIGKSGDADKLFFLAILRRFLHVMTDKYASYVAVRGMQVFDDKKKELMYEHILPHALRVACDKHGYIALNEVITDLDHPFYRDQLLDIVALNALLLSYDAYGNYVVQHVLTLNDLRCTYNIAVSLVGYCVELSLDKCGSYIVEKLLEAEESMVLVVEELLECEGGSLMRLARNEYGSFVVIKALRVMQEMNRVDLFRGLVQKLMPFRHLLRRPCGNTTIAAIIESKNRNPPRTTTLSVLTALFRIVSSSPSEKGSKSTAIDDSLGPDGVYSPLLSSSPSEEGSKSTTIDDSLGSDCVTCVISCFLSVLTASPPLIFVFFE
uniref:PUM-HD domain-containing protein n=1 Tax=Brassica oleracea var. oleracea TaxID=109376 RepID=A0A0D3ECT8_BRAOL